MWMETALALRTHNHLGMLGERTRMTYAEMSQAVRCAMDMVRACDCPEDFERQLSELNDEPAEEGFTEEQHALVRLILCNEYEHAIGRA
jgi:hypothetical protein